MSDYFEGLTPDYEIEIEEGVLSKEKVDELLKCLENEDEEENELLTK